MGGRGVDTGRKSLHLIRMWKWRQLVPFSEYRLGPVVTDQIRRRGAGARGSPGRVWRVDLKRRKGA